MSAELKADFEDVSVELIAGGGGIFEVKKEGEVVYQKARSDDFPAPGVVSAAIKGS